MSTDNFDQTNIDNMRPINYRKIEQFFRRNRSELYIKVFELFAVWTTGCEIYELSGEFGVRLNLAVNSTPKCLVIHGFMMILIKSRNNIWRWLLSECERNSINTENGGRCIELVGTYLEISVNQLIHCSYEDCYRKLKDIPSTTKMKDVEANLSQNVRLTHNLYLVSCSIVRKNFELKILFTIAINKNYHLKIDAVYDYYIRMIRGGTMLYAPHSHFQYVNMKTFLMEIERKQHVVLIIKMVKYKI
ncbi:hypothetical protein Bhyg_05356 [Pseudolycoriella hygida]|uniref:Uncharacterized protein n=1 Tax=Pseudolycoriella hygida TaxID=35572 RepID=A0A9Q0NHG3_9DIPT|nr:hypothetical protein Bhyg_05356 [Pseudolycoriella hygida]